LIILLLLLDGAYPFFSARIMVKGKKTVAPVKAAPKAKAVPMDKAAPKAAPQAKAVPMARAAPKAKPKAVPKAAPKAPAAAAKTSSGVSKSVTIEHCKS